ncbi:unnamed protein product, partial [Rotaria magnacalcarata]
IPNRRCGTRDYWCCGRIWLSGTVFVLRSVREQVGMMNVMIEPVDGDTIVRRSS